jgi:hypothetical protein
MTAVTPFTFPATGQQVLDPPQVRVTAKGLSDLHQLLGGVAPLRVDAAAGSHP